MIEGVSQVVVEVDELRARGVEFPQAPVQQSWGWWSMFRDEEGNRFALHPREAT